MREKNLDEVEVYKKGNISRQLFSKIKSEKDYHPAKNTIFSLAIGMELSISETSELLEKAGYSFSSAIKSDLISHTRREWMSPKSFFVARRKVQMLPR